jgi:signal transduction histidine kinase
MLDRLRHSLAFRLGSLYALLFSAGGAAVFIVLYYFLAAALETKVRSEVEQRANAYATLYEQGGAAALRARIVDEERGPEGGSLLVRILGEGGNTVFARVPPDWIERQVQSIPIPGFFGQSFQVQQVVQTVRIPRDAEKDFITATRPLSDGRALQVARSTDNQATLLAPLRNTFLAVGPGALLLAALAGIWLAWRVTRPLREVRDTARRIVETGDLAARVPEPSSSGELAELARQFNTVLTQNGALIGAQREALDNLAHDLRTPLTRLRGTAELALQAEGDTASAREALADCVEESERVLRLLEAMMDVTAAETGSMRLQLAPVDLRTLAAEAVDLYREVAEEKRIGLSMEAGDALVVNADPLRLRQALANLVDNAVKYTPEGGKVECRLIAAGARVSVEITDTGLGVPEAEREKIWRRLYRGDQSRSQRGLGLGLSLVKAIVEAHHGSVAVGDAPGGGARFSITLAR